MNRGIRYRDPNHLLYQALNVFISTVKTGILTWGSYGDWLAFWPQVAIWWPPVFGTCALASFSKSGCDLGRSTKMKKNGQITQIRSRAESRNKLCCSPDGAQMCSVAQLSITAKYDQLKVSEAEVLRHGLIFWLTKTNWFGEEQLNADARQSAHSLPYFC